MGLRAYRAGRMVADEAQALLASVSKKQQAVHKETQALAERLDRSGNARRAESMRTQMEIAAAERDAAQFKAATAAAAAVVSVAMASTVTLSLAATRHAERQEGRLDVLEEQHLRRQAGLRVEALERPRRQGDEPASYKKVFDATLGTAANWLRGLGRSKAAQADAKPSADGDRHAGAVDDNRRLDLMGDLAEAKRRHQEAGAKVQASVGEGFVHQLIVYGMYLHAEKRLLDAEAAWEGWHQDHPDHGRVDTRQGTNGPPTVEAAERPDRDRRGSADGRGHARGTHEQHERPERHDAVVGYGDRERGSLATSPADGGRHELAVGQPASTVREATVRPGPLPPPVPGLPPAAGTQQRPIIQAPVDLVRSAMPQPVPNGSFQAAASAAVAQTSQAAAPVQTAVSPSSPAIEPLLRAPSPQDARRPILAANSSAETPTTAATPTADRPSATEPPAPGGPAGGSTIDGRAQAHLQRWRDDRLHLPLTGTQAERLQELGQRAVAGTLTPGELRSNADLFSDRERVQMEGLLRADIGAAYVGGEASSLTAQRLAMLAGVADGAPPLAIDDERMRSLQVSVAALDLVAASEEVANGGGQEALARQHAARARYEDAVYGTTTPGASSATERGWRQLVSEAQIAMGAGDYGPAALHALQNLSRGIEEAHRYGTEARAQAVRLAMARKMLAEAEQEQASLTINPK